MKYYYMMPYILVLLVFFVMMFLSLLQQRKMKKFMQREIHKSEIQLELIELQHEYDILCEAGTTDGFPVINDSLREIARMLKILGIRVNLNEIKVVPVSKDPMFMEKMRKLKDERDRAPEELQTLLINKLILVNKIAMIKHPWTYLLNRITCSVQTDSLILLMRILILAFKILEKCNSLRKIKSEKKSFVDSYQYIHCS